MISVIMRDFKLYSLQRRRERYCIILIWKIIENKSQNLSDPILCNFSNRRGRSCVISHVDMGRLGTLAYCIASNGEILDYLIPFLKLFVISKIVLFVASSKDLITISAAFLPDLPRLALMWQQSGTLLFCSCHGIARFFVDELQI